jgi:hypothetical protein
MNDVAGTDEFSTAVLMRESPIMRMIGQNISAREEQSVRFQVKKFFLSRAL